VSVYDHGPHSIVCPPCSCHASCHPAFFAISQHDPPQVLFASLIALSAVCAVSLIVLLTSESTVELTSPADIAIAHLKAANVQAHNPAVPKDIEDSFKRAMEEQKDMPKISSAAKHDLSAAEQKSLDQAVKELELEKKLEKEKSSAKAAKPQTK
jgi:methionine-rich copper-binding protein CopC